ncbi:MAG: hypothetical protein WAR77_08620 [Saprospiraceae bacterium]|nr:hypothetical protein [Saprospiraceae bacterium]MBK8451102.1 hypothetical protein [Saprospiraceae bacterium]
MNLKFLCCLIVLFVSLSKMDAQSANVHFDSTLTAKYGADDYGMKWYILVLLKTGTGVEQDAGKRKELFEGHLKNIRSLADQGKLTVAGPLEKNDRYRGIFILNLSNKEDALLLLESDPAIKAKLLEPELIRWYGSAALPAYLDVEGKLGKFRF